MDNHLIVQNGLQVNADALITGGLQVYGDITGSYAYLTSSWAITASYALTASYLEGLAEGTASWSVNSITASYIAWSGVDESTSDTFAGTASYALTASYAANAGLPSGVVSSSTQLSNGGENAFTSSSNVTFGQITASIILVEKLYVQTITSSVEIVTGSLTVSGSLTAIGGITGSLFGTSSYAVTASYALSYSGTSGSSGSSGTSGSSGSSGTSGSSGSSGTSGSSGSSGTSGSSGSSGTSGSSGSSGTSGSSGSSGTSGSSGSSGTSGSSGSSGTSGSSGSSGTSGSSGSSGTSGSSGSSGTSGSSGSSGTSGSSGSSGTSGSSGSSGTSGSSGSSGTSGSSGSSGTSGSSGSSGTSGSSGSSGTSGSSGSSGTSGEGTIVGGTTNYISKFSDPTTLVTSSIYDDGSNVLITGSVNITGSTTQIGNNTLLGNTTLSGSLIISGAYGTNNPTIRIYGDTQVDGYVRFDPVNTNVDQSISASYIYVSGSTQDLYFSQNGAGYQNTTRLRWLEGNLYTGLLNGGYITTQSATVYQISSGSGIVVNLNASLTNNPYPTITYVNWPNISASIAPLSGSYDQSFVAVTSAGTIYAQGVPYSDGQFNTLIPIGVVVHQNRSTINAVTTFPSVAYGYKQRSSDFIRAFGALKLSGLNTYASGSSTGSLIISSGTAFAEGRNYSVDPNSPSYVIDNGTSVSKIYRYYQSGSDWKYLTNGGAGYLTIDPTQYSNNGVLTAVPGVGSNREWTIQRVYWFPGGATKGIYVYYGNTPYLTKADAIANINIESFTEAPNTAASAVLSAYLILRNDADFTNAATYQILQAGLFRSVGGSGGGGSSITQTLSGLSDVNISGPTNGQALVYDNVAARWVNSSTITASLHGNADTATSASHAAHATTSSYSLKAESLLSGININVNEITASNILVTNLHVQNITSSTEIVTDRLVVSGSLLVTGSMTLTGSLNITGPITGTASYAITSSYALTASYIDGGFY